MDEMESRAWWRPHGWRVLAAILIALLLAVGLVTISRQRESGSSPYPFYTPRSRIRKFETRVLLHHVAKGLSYYRRENNGQFPQPAKLPDAFGKYVAVPYADISPYVNLAHSYDDGKPMLSDFDGVICPVDAWGNPVLFFQEPDADPDIESHAMAARNPGGGRTSMPIVASAGPNEEWEGGHGDDLLNQVSSDPHRQR